MNPKLKTGRTHKTEHTDKKDHENNKEYKNKKENNDKKERKKKETENKKECNDKKKCKNKGTGAGGANTNFFGKSFECKTSVEERLHSIGFVKKKMNNSKYGYYLEYILQDTIIIYLTQSGLKTYFKLKYGIILCRNPDEVYIIKTNDNCIIKILEKKEQHCNGSVETKLWSGPSLKREYEIILGNKFIVDYAYCINNFLSEKFNSDNLKYNVLKQILKENNITILHADNKNYYEQLEHWIKRI